MSISQYLRYFSTTKYWSLLVTYPNIAQEVTEFCLSFSEIIRPNWPLNSLFSLYLVYLRMLHQDLQGYLETFPIH